MAQSKFPMHVSPIGTASWPWLNKPDVRFDPDGIYHVKLIMSKGDAKKVQGIVDPLMNGGKHNPVKAELNDVGEDTGNYVVQFKMKSHVKTRKGEFDQKPVILDKEGNRIDAIVGAGTKMKVDYQAIPFDQGGGGVTMRLQKVRVLDLVEYEGGSGSDLDWGDEFKKDDVDENDTEDEDF